MANEQLLPLRAVRRHLRVLGERYLGMREIATSAIVGSVDRSVDFDRFFRTRRRDLQRRLNGLREAFRNQPMPPITVYEAGGLYFVVDGHHRVALAREQGSEFIDAEVTQIDTSHRLHAGVDVLELIHTEQHRRFQERAGLLEAASGAIIEFSRPSAYGDRYLWTHRKLQELRAADHSATWQDAAAVLARLPAQRGHRRDTLAMRRKPLPNRTS